MAKTARAEEYMRNLRLTFLDTHCDHDDCHGTHVDRIDWEIARRHVRNAPQEIVDELDDEERHQQTWFAYVSYAAKRYGSPLTPPPFEPKRTRVIIPPEVAAVGIDQETLRRACWICSEPECLICTTPQGSNRLQRYVLRERSALRRSAYLNDPELINDFFAERERILQEMNDPLMEDSDVRA